MAILYTRDCDRCKRTFTDQTVNPTCMQCTLDQPCMVGSTGIASDAEKRIEWHRKRARDLGQELGDLRWRHAAAVTLIQALRLGAKFDIVDGTDGDQLTMMMQPALPPNLANRVSVHVKEITDLIGLTDSMSLAKCGGHTDLSMKCAVCERIGKES